MVAQRGGWPAWIAWCLLYAVVSVACALYYCSVVPSPDQSLYDYIAWQGIKSIPWYSGSVDVSWPGPLLIEDLGIRAFGVQRWTARLTDFLVLQPALVAMFFFLRSAGLRRAALAIVIVYPVIYVTAGGWQAGHRDIVGMQFLIASAALLLGDGARWRGCLLAGVVLGFVVMLRPTYLALAPVLWLAALPRPFEPRGMMRALVPLALGTLVVPLAFAVAGLMMGNLWDWYDVGIRFVLNVYQVDGSRWRLLGLAWIVISQPMAWLAVAGVLGGGIWVANAGAAPRHLLLLAGMLATVAISYAVQNKGFGYHLGGLIPILTVLALGGAELALHSRLTAPVRVAASTAAICIVLVMAAGVARRSQHYILPFLAQLRIDDPATFQDQVAATNEAVAIIDRESGPNDRFFQWGWNSDVGFLAQRLSASRFVFPLFAQIDAKTRYMGWIATFQQEMARNRPAFVLLDLTTVPPGTDTAQFPLLLPADNRSPGLRALVDLLDRDYVVRARWPDRILFERAS